VEIKIDQIAVYAEEPLMIVDMLKKIGLRDWIEDEVIAEGFVYGRKTTNKARLFFNYQLLPCEFEVLQYERGDFWHKIRGLERGRIFISHFGMHVEDIEKYKHVMFAEFPDIRPIQEMITISHQNLAIKDRTYKYIIFDTLSILGYDLKVIQRIFK